MEAARGRARRDPRPDNSHRGSGDREPFERASDTALEKLALEGEYLREALIVGVSQHCDRRCDLGRDWRGYMLKANLYLNGKK